MCQSDPNCYGIMYNSGWASAVKGVKVCTSSTLKEKPEKDWSVFLKCESSGNWIRKSYSWTKDCTTPLFPIIKISYDKFD